MTGRPKQPIVTITYCLGCNWLLRAGWLAQELLQTFKAELGGVTIVPSEIGGRFRVEVGDVQLWERKRDGGFPDSAELKRRVRDVINPGGDLGHVDKGQD